MLPSPQQQKGDRDKRTRVSAPVPRRSGPCVPQSKLSVMRRERDAIAGGKAGGLQPNTTRTSDWRSSKSYLSTLADPYLVSGIASKCVESAWPRVGPCEIGGPRTAGIATPRPRPSRIDLLGSSEAMLNRQKYIKKRGCTNWAVVVPNRFASLSLLRARPPGQFGIGECFASPCAQPLRIRRRPLAPAPLELLGGALRVACASWVQRHGLCEAGFVRMNRDRFQSMAPGRASAPFGLALLEFILQRFVSPLATQS